MPGVVEKTSKKVSKNAYRRSKKKEKAKREVRLPSLSMHRSVS
jgi:hypothetical protein